jgi:hypothetical protein
LPYLFQARPYAFTYGVKDDYSGTDFSRAEESSGQVTKGQYQVALPDGRIQVNKNLQIFCLFLYHLL